MNLSPELIALVLGIVEGLTEFLPVSSTGHLILAGHALGFVGEKAKFFEVFIQLGAIIAVVILYPRFFLRLIPGRDKPGQGDTFSGVEGLMKLGMGTLPVLLVGFLLHGFIKRHLFNPFTVAIGLILGSVLILYVERRNLSAKRSAIEQITYLDCLKVGLFQCLALWPGVSRAGATIVGALLLGFERKLAAEFSFLLAVPALTAAVLYDIYKNHNLLTSGDAVFFAIGFFVSLVTAIVAIRGFLGYLKRHNFAIFAYYRLVLALAVLVLLR